MSKFLPVAKCAIGYVLVVIFAVVIVYGMAILKPSGSEFLGVYLILVTLPWSLILHELIDLIGLSSLPHMDTAVLILSALLNVGLLYWLGLKRALSRKDNQ